MVKTSEGGTVPTVLCPECSQPVTGASSRTHTEWVLRDEYAGMVGLPVGEPYGKQVPIYGLVTYEPCGHVHYVSVSGEPS